MMLCKKMLEEKQEEREKKTYCWGYDNEARRENYKITVK